MALVAAMFAALETGRGMGDVGAFALVAPEILPYLYIPQGVILLVAALGFGAALGRVARGRLFVAVLLALALLVVVEAVAIRAGTDGVVPLAWLTVAAAGATAMTIGWTVAASTFDARQAKRLFPLCTAAAIAGYALGSLAAGPVARIGGTEALIAAEGVLFVVAALVIGRIAARRPTPAWGPPAASARSVLADVRVGLDEVRGSALLSRISVAYVLLAILLVAVTVPFWSAATATIPNEAERAGAVGVITAVVTAASFVVSLVVANRFYARFGIASAALLLPIVYLVGFAVWTVAFSFATAVGVLAVVQITQRGLSNAAWSAFSTTVPAHRRAQVLIFLDGVPVQIGAILSGVLLLTAARVLDPVQVFLGGAAIAAITVIVVFGVRQRYAASLLATLRRGVGEQVLEGGPGLGSLVTAPDVRAVLVTALADADPRVREMAAMMLARAPGDDTLDALLGALDDPEPVLRGRARRPRRRPPRARGARRRGDRRPPGGRTARAGGRAPRAAPAGAPTGGDDPGRAAHRCRSGRSGGSRRDTRARGARRRRRRGCRSTPRRARRPDPRRATCGRRRTGGQTNAAASAVRPARLARRGHPGRGCPRDDRAR